MEDINALPDSLVPPDTSTPPGTSTPPSTEDLIMKLSAELRNQIYELSLSHRYTHTFGRVGLWKEPALLKACKQIRSEALPLYYHINNFKAGVFNDDFKDLVEWLESILSMSGNKLPFKSFSLIVYERPNMPWEDVHCFLPLAEFLRSTDAEILQEHDQWGKTNGLPTWIRTTSYNGRAMPVVMENYLRQAVKLGYKAKAKSWSAQQLAKAYNRKAAMKKAMKTYQDFVAKGKLKRAKIRVVLECEVMMWNRWLRSEEEATDAERKDVRKKLRRIHRELDELDI